MVVTCELRRGWQEGASHDDLPPRQKAPVQYKGPGWNLSRKHGAWRKATQERVRGWVGSGQVLEAGLC